MWRLNLHLFHSFIVQEEKPCIIYSFIVYESLWAAFAFTPKLSGNNNWVQNGSREKLAWLTTNNWKLQLALALSKGVKFN